MFVIICITIIIIIIISIISSSSSSMHSNVVIVIISVIVIIVIAIDQRGRNLSTVGEVQDAWMATCLLQQNKCSTKVDSSIV